MAGEVSTALESIVSAIRLDTGLTAATSLSKINKGIIGARLMNDVIASAVDSTNANADGMIKPDEVRRISDVIRADFALYGKFVVGHGDDEGNVETGFHHVQSNGGMLEFQGRKLIDTVIDALYHVGFEYNATNFVNEDGNNNERIADIAGWLNYFLNGVNIVFGSSGRDELGSGKYSKQLAAAANETFYAGAGNDNVWAEAGNDKVFAGAGNDTVGGGTGNDKMYGGVGADTLYGDAGSDSIFGEAGNDKIGGGDNSDRLNGGAGDDTIWGDKGNDLIQGGDGNDEIGGGLGDNTLEGGAGNDHIHGDSGRDLIMGGDGADDIAGGAGSDKLFGNAGADEISAGDGVDVIFGGTGADRIFLWDGNGARDTVVVRAGESGRTTGTIDVIEGFTSGEDKIDLRSFGLMKFTKFDFSGGSASAYYDGHYLRIDSDGDRATDVMVELKWVDTLASADFLLA